MRSLLNRLRRPAAPPRSSFPGLPAGHVPTCVDFGRPCHDHCACEPVRLRAG